jgi:hypothetical protein
MGHDGDVDAVLGSGTVDAVFWALVCADEEWLRSEFDGIVSEPAELRQTPPTRLTVSTPVNGERSWAEAHPAGAVRTRPWRHGAAPGRAWRRQRGPPCGCLTTRSRSVES